MNLTARLDIREETLHITHHDFAIEHGKYEGPEFTVATLSGRTPGVSVDVLLPLCSRLRLEKVLP
jgi:hypothetical protein